MNITLDQNSQVKLSARTTVTLFGGSKYYSTKLVNSCFVFTIYHRCTQLTPPLGVALVQAAHEAPANQNAVTGRTGFRPQHNSTLKDEEEKLSLANSLTACLCHIQP